MFSKKKSTRTSSRRTSQVSQSFRMPSNTASAQDIAAIQSLPLKMQQRCWSKIRSILANNREEIRKSQFLRVPVFAQADPTSAETLLHLALKCQPPMDIILELLGGFPEAVSLPDSMGRLPLHVAAEYGASSAVILHLLVRNENAAGEQNATGKTPLHLACKTYTLAYNPTNDAKTMEHAFGEVVRMLGDAAPAAVNMEDNQGMTPLEYALEWDCPYPVYRKLQKQSQKSWKQSQQAWKGFNEMSLNERDPVDIVKRRMAADTSPRASPMLCRSKRRLSHRATAA